MTWGTGRKGQMNTLTLTFNRLGFLIFVGVFAAFNVIDTINLLAGHAPVSTPAWLQFCTRPLLAVLWICLFVLVLRMRPPKEVAND